MSLLIMVVEKMTLMYRGKAIQQMLKLFVSSDAYKWVCQGYHKPAVEFGPGTYFSMSIIVFL
jgi:hypothetical protein